MKSTRASVRGLTAGLALSCLVSLPIFSAEPMATMSAAGAGVHWDTRSEAPELRLSVAGPETHIQRVSRSGGPLSLSLTGADGTALPDGLYKWEIRESYAGLNDNVYDPYNGRGQVDAATSDSKIEVHGRVESGVFTVKNGFVVDSALEESEAAASSKEAQ